MNFSHKLALKVLRQIYDDLLETKLVVDGIKDDAHRQKLMEELVDLQNSTKKLFNHYKKIADRLSPQ